MIHFSRVTKRYASGQSALLNVSFDIAPGEMVFLTGHSGAGKSTLLKLIALIEKPSGGQVIVDGLNFERVGAKSVPLIRRKIGLIFQDAQLLPERTLLENVSLPLVIAGYKAREVTRRAQAGLDKVGLLSKAYQLPETLSVGEQQRAGIARAIVTKPPIILADEPTGNLDPDLSREMMSMFEQFNQLGATIIIATHDHAMVESMGYRRINLHEGQLA